MAIVAIRRVLHRTTAGRRPMSLRDAITFARTRPQIDDRYSKWHTLRDYDTHSFMPGFSKHQSFLSKEAWVSELTHDNKLEQAISRATTIGEGESYSNLHKLFGKLV